MTLAPVCNACGDLIDGEPVVLHMRLDRNGHEINYTFHYHGESWPRSCFVNPIVAVQECADPARLRQGEGEQMPANGNDHKEKSTCRA